MGRDCGRAAVPPPDYEELDVKRILALVFPLMAAACSSNPEPVLWDDPGMKVIMSKKPAPLPLSIAIAPVEIGFTEGEIRSSLKRKHVITKDVDEFRAEAAEILTKTSAFSKVRLLEGEAAGDFRKEMLQKAWEGGDDLVLFLKLHRYETTFEGNNGNYIPSLLLWIMFLFPSWWIADESYGAAVDLEVEVVSAHSGRQVARTTFSASEKRDLDDFDRGWSLLGILSVPSSLDEENWEKVSKVVSPYPITRVQAEFAKFFHEEFPKKTGTPEFPKNMAKTLGMFVGISRYDSYTLHNIKYASRDAEIMHAALTGEGEGKIAPRNAMLLQNEQATAANLTKAVEEFLMARARPVDTVILYFAGYGGFGPGKGGNEPYIMPFDYDHKTGLAKSAIPLSWLKDSVEKIAGGVVVMLDASFCGDGEGRSFSEMKQGASSGQLESLVSGRTRAAALFGAGAGEHALEFEDKQAGLFSFYLVEGLEGKADRDKDGFVIAGELAAYASENVYKRSLLQGDSQKPVIFDGGGAAQVRLSIAKKQG